MFWLRLARQRGKSVAHVKRETDNAERADLMAFELLDPDIGQRLDELAADIVVAIHHAAWYQAPAGGLKREMHEWKELKLTEAELVEYVRARSIAIAPMVGQMCAHGKQGE